MLSFELSAIDLILVIAVVILSILYLTRLSDTPVAEEKSSVEERIPLDRRARTITPSKTGRIPSPTHPLKDSAKCPHHFGYLKKLGKNIPIPDECLSCPRIVGCFGSNPDAHVSS